MSNQISLEHLTVHPPRTYRNLSVYPLTSRDVHSADYLTLDDALNTGQVNINEISHHGSVPQLRLKNDLDRPVLLLDGEELVGAKQNRVLNLTILAQPHWETIIPVSCVEAGRWSHRTLHFATSENVQFARSRAKKVDRVSESLASSGSAAGRQYEVWDDIGAMRCSLGVGSATDAMADIYSGVETDISAYIEALVKSDLPEGMIGAAFALDGRIAGVEMFETPALFSRLRTKLIRSWALEAVGAARNGTIATVPTNDKVSAFIATVQEAPTRDFPAIGLGHSIRFAGDDVIGSALMLNLRLIHLTAFPARFVRAVH